MRPGSSTFNDNERRLRNPGGSRARIPSSGVTAYNYGYPAYGAVEPNVAAQWIFDEASGDIVDEVAGLTLADTGSPTYNVAATGIYAGLSPGITLSNGTYFSHNTDTSLAPGTSDFVWECWYKSTGTLVNGTLWFSTMESPGADEDGMSFGFVTGADGNSLGIWVRATDSTLLNLTVAGIATDLDDTNIHKLRIVGDRDATLNTYVDGVAEGSADFTGLTGKTIAAYFAGVGTTYATGVGNEIAATIFEIRLTIGNATNNSGGPSGG